MGFRKLLLGFFKASLNFMRMLAEKFFSMQEVLALQKYKAQNGMIQILVKDGKRTGQNIWFKIVLNLNKPL